MKTVLWALGLGTLLLTLRALPIGKFLLPSSMEASGGSGSVELETLGCGISCCDLLSVWLLFSPEVDGSSRGKRACGLQSIYPWRLLF